MLNTIRRKCELDCGRFGLALSVSLFLLPGFPVAAIEQQEDAAVAKKPNVYPVTRYREYGFSVKPKLSHNLTTRGLKAYSIVFNPVLTQKNEQTEVYFYIDEIGEYQITSQVSLPGTSHVQIVIGGRCSGEFKTSVTGAGGGAGKLEQGYFTRIPVALLAKMAQANKVVVRLYWKSVNGADVEQNDLRTFELDARSQRTIAKLLVLGERSGLARAQCP